MADKFTRLRDALAPNEGTSFVDSMKASIKRYQGDGASAQTHRAMREAGIDVTQDEVQDVDELISRQTMDAVPKDATIAMPNGTRITPLQYQKLMQMQLKRGG